MVMTQVYFKRSHFPLIYSEVSIGNAVCHRPLFAPKGKAQKSDLVKVERGGNVHGGQGSDKSRARQDLSESRKVG